MAYGDLALGKQNIRRVVSITLNDLL